MEGRGEEEEKAVSGEKDVSIQTQNAAFATKTYVLVLFSVFRDKELVEKELG